MGSLTILLWSALACAPVLESPPPSPAEAEAAEPEAAAPKVDDTQVAAVVADAPPQAPVRVPLETVALGPVTRVLDLPVASLALGRPAVAALVHQDGGLVPWWTDAKGSWRAIPLPAALALSDATAPGARIHFGRNDKPRILGTRTVEGANRPLYLRFRGSSWVADKEEVPELLAGSPAGLYGVLGHADPEVVCKVGASCLIKRLSGWKRMDAAATAPRVDLQGGRAFAVWPTEVAVLDGLRWQVLSADVDLVDARGVWGDQAETWISGGESTLWHHTAEGWDTQAAPVTGADQLWGSGPDDVWLAGTGGLAHYDGTRWARVADVEGPLSEVFGRHGEVWAAGESGVWRIDWTWPPLPPELVDSPQLIDAQGRPLPQTDARPSASSPAFRRRLDLLWEAVVLDDPDRALFAFFPLEAYKQVKAIDDPTVDWNQRLVAAFARSIHTWHDRVGEGATLEGVALREDRVRWMPPGSEGNHLGYFRVTRAQLTYRKGDEVSSLEIASLISWRGEWFVVHLDGFE